MITVVELFTTQAMFVHLWYLAFMCFDNFITFFLAR